MKKMLDMLKGGRRIELFLALVAAAVLLLQLVGSVSTCSGTGLEQRLEGILGQIEGVGRVKVMVTENVDGEAEGVLVVAEGADDIGVCLQLQYAVQTLLGTDAARIEIVRYAR